MFGLSGIFKGISAVLSVINKFTPSREEKAGQAITERDQMKEKELARKRMDDVPVPDEQSTTDSLRRGDF